MAKKANAIRVKAVGRPKKHAPKKRAKAQWDERAVIHQDVFFSEAPTNGGG